MDPTTAWQTVTNHNNNDINERADNAAALIGWLDTGGYLPHPNQTDLDDQSGPMTHNRVYRICAEVLTAAWNQR